MKSITKERTIILAILGMTLLLNFPFWYSLDFCIRADSHSLKASSAFHFKTKNLKASKISGIIYINNNWTDAKNAGICNGSGIYSDPYLIKDLIIDGGNTSNCIKIQNSSVYFRIENCTLFNAGTDLSSQYAGILLNHTRNGMIVNNNCSKNMYGIFLVSYSSNNTLYGNYVNYNFYSGISLSTFCSNNTISRNNANNNSVFGISISWNSHNNTISKNNATKNKI
ncbi:MAG: right-handed parallel beta-helix repeat-containing protein, partial [Promethearchaeota archaeon]